MGKIESTLWKLISLGREELRRREHLLTALTNTGWLIAERLLRLGLGLFVWVWLARYLGPDNFGVYNYAHAFVGLFAVIAGLGLDGIVVREVVRGSTARYEVLGAAFVLKLIAGLFALVLAILSVSLLRPNDALMHWLVGILAAGMMFQSFSVIDLWFQSQIRAKYSVCARTLAFLVVIAAFVTLILKKAPLIAFALTSLAETVLAAGGLVVLYIATGYRIRDWRFNRVWAKTLIKDGWPLILSGLAITVYMKIDQIMIGEMIGGRAVGLYSAATRISEVWYFVPVAVVSSVFPTLIRSKQWNEELYLRRFQNLYDLMIWLALGIAIPTVLMSGGLVHTLYGPDYAAASTVLALHIWAAVFVFLGIATGKWYLAENMHFSLFRRTLAGGILNILLNFFLIPRYGINGAAIATLVSQAWAAYFHDLLDPATRRVFYMKSRSLLFVSVVKKAMNG